MRKPIYYPAGALVLVGLMVGSAYAQGVNRDGIPQGQQGPAVRQPQPTGEQAAKSPQMPSLELSSEQRRLVFKAVFRPAAEISVRTRLALGASIGPDVPLERFPTRIVHTIPMLDRYRAVVSQDEVLIVEPVSREIVLIVNE